MGAVVRPENIEKGVDILHPWAVECLLMKPKKELYQNRIELLQGTLDMLILQTLQWGPQHGYGDQPVDSRPLGRSLAG